MKYLSSELQYVLDKTQSKEVKKVFNNVSGLVDAGSKKSVALQMLNDTLDKVKLNSCPHVTAYLAKRNLTSSLRSVIGHIKESSLYKKYKPFSKMINNVESKIGKVNEAQVAEEFLSNIQELTDGQFMAKYINNIEKQLEASKPLLLVKEAIQGLQADANKEIFEGLVVQLEKSFVLPAAMIPNFVKGACRDFFGSHSIIDELVAKMMVINTMKTNHNQSQVRLVGNGQVYESIQAPTIIGFNGKDDAFFHGGKHIVMQNDGKVRFMTEEEEKELPSEYNSLCNAVTSCVLNEEGSIIYESDEHEFEIDGDKIRIDSSEEIETEEEGVQAKLAMYNISLVDMKNIMSLVNFGSQNIHRLDNVSMVSSPQENALIVKMNENKALIVFNEEIDEPIVKDELDDEQIISELQNYVGIDVSSLIKKSQLSKKSKSRLDKLKVALKAVTESIEEIEDEDEDIQKDSAVKKMKDTLVSKQKLILDKIKGVEDNTDEEAIFESKFPNYSTVKSLTASKEMAMANGKKITVDHSNIAALAVVFNVLNNTNQSIFESKLLKNEKWYNAIINFSWEIMNGAYNVNAQFNQLITESADDFDLPEGDVHDEEVVVDDVNEGLKVGDKLKGDINGVDREGKVTSIDGDMAQVDFGNGDGYGIHLTRIENGEFTVNESVDDTKNTIQMAISYKVNMAQIDLDELGEETSVEKFKSYFNIPDDADEDPNYARDKNFDERAIGKLNEEKTEMNSEATSILANEIKQVLGDIGVDKPTEDDIKRIIGDMDLPDIDIENVDMEYIMTYLNESEDEEGKEEMITEAKKMLFESGFVSKEESEDEEFDYEATDDGILAENEDVADDIMAEFEDTDIEAKVDDENPNMVLVGVGEEEDEEGLPAPVVAEEEVVLPVPEEDEELVNESGDTRDTISLAMTYKVNISMGDIKELGEETSVEKFKSYFNIPDDADEDPNYARDSDFDATSLKRSHVRESSDESSNWFIVNKDIETVLGSYSSEEEAYTALDEIEEEEAYVATRDEIVDAGKGDLLGSELVDEDEVMVDSDYEMTEEDEDMLVEALAKLFGSSAINESKAAKGKYVVFNKLNKKWAGLTEEDEAIVYGEEEEAGEAAAEASKNGRLSVVRKIAESEDDENEEPIVFDEEFDGGEFNDGEEVVEESEIEDQQPPIELDDARRIKEESEEDENGIVVVDEEVIEEPIIFDEEFDGERVTEDKSRGKDFYYSVGKQIGGTNKLRREYSDENMVEISYGDIIIQLFDKSRINDDDSYVLYDINGKKTLETSDRAEAEAEFIKNIKSIREDGVRRIKESEENENSIVIDEPEEPIESPADDPDDITDDFNNMPEPIMVDEEEDYVPNEEDIPENL